MIFSFSLFLIIIISFQNLSIFLSHDPYRKRHFSFSKIFSFLNLWSPTRIVNIIFFLFFIIIFFYNFSVPIANNTSLFQHHLYYSYFWSPTRAVPKATQTSFLSTSFSIFNLFVLRRQRQEGVLSPPLGSRTLKGRPFKNPERLKGP